MTRDDEVSGAEHEHEHDHARHSHHDAEAHGGHAHHQHHHHEHEREHEHRQRSAADRAKGGYAAFGGERRRLEPAELAARQAGQGGAITAGGASGKTLFIDAFSGVAGDMLVAALLDLGVPWSVVEDAVAALGMDGYHLSLSSGYAGAIGALGFDVHVDPRQPQRTYANIEGLLLASNLDDATRRLAGRIFLRLAQAEAEVHRIALEDVHFHEVGAVDAIADIVGAAACFTHLGARVVGSALPLGRGFVECQHGILPLPAPATVNALRGVPTYAAEVEAELVTPTGAAVVATVCEGFVSWPSLAPERVGFGLGTRRLPDRPNALRVVLGNETRSGAEETGTHVLIEANVDDMTGELAAHCLRAVLDAGALDAWAVPIVMKKGRPGLVLSVLCARAVAPQLSRVLLRESSSLGVRRTPVSRDELPREVVDVETPYGVVPVKVAGVGSAHVKPEFEVCARLARAAEVPLRLVLEAATSAARARLGARG
ncbi:MAG TPA: nickel pincer cofactor biosynthesis protein LarC [Polyangiaceae bacterium]